MPEKIEKSVFATLNAINVNEKTEVKNGLTYLSWAWAWAEVKKLYPDATYTIYECVNPMGYVCNYFSDGRTCWVKTGVTIGGLEHIEELPVMDCKNKSSFLDSVTSFDVNKAIQRSLTKAVARHGLGLYIYAGEDLPEGAEEEKKEKKEEPKQDSPITEEQLKQLSSLEDKVKNVIYEKENIKTLKELTMFNASKWIKYCQSKNLL
jgi:hypothetical protein